MITYQDSLFLFGFSFNYDYGVPYNLTLNTFI